jgi:hypothetical protein
MRSKFCQADNSFCDFSLPGHDSFRFAANHTSDILKS